MVPSRVELWTEGRWRGVVWGVWGSRTPPPPQGIPITFYSDPVLILRPLVSASFPVMSIHSPLRNMASPFLTEVPFHPKEYCFQNLSSLILSPESEKNPRLQLHLFFPTVLFLGKNRIFIPWNLGLWKICNPKTSVWLGRGGKYWFCFLCQSF